MKTTQPEILPLQTHVALRRGVSLLPLLLFAVQACSSGGEAPRPGAEPVARAKSAYSSHAWVDGNVAAFKALDQTTVYVLGTNGNLWRETGSMSNRTWVDGNVRAFQPLRDGVTVYVLSTDGSLWRENGSMSNRTLVKGGVAAFQASDPPTSTQSVYVLGTDGTLWSEDSSPLAQIEVEVQVDVNVAAFQAGFDAFPSTPFLYVLQTDGTLWRGGLGKTIGRPGSSYTPAVIDMNASSFLALDGLTVYVLGSDGNLWHERDTWKTRAWVDGNVIAFAPLDASLVYVEGTDKKLWRESYDMKQRDLVDQDVTAYQPVGASAVYTLMADGNLWLDQLPAPVCTLYYPPPTESNPYVAAWGVLTPSGACLDLVGATGRWREIAPSATGNGVPGDPSYQQVPPDCAPLLGAGCCTYVWLPNGTELQDTSLLCGQGTTPPEAILEGGFRVYPTGLSPGSPASPECDTCDPEPGSVQ